MSPEIVERELKKIIEDIQQSTGLECPPLDGKVIPANDVPEFTSPIWIAATTLLAGKLGIDIPNDENIFIDKHTNAALSLEDIAKVVCSVASLETSDEAVA